MSLTASLYPSTRVFTGNPVRLQVSTSSLCTYKMYMGTALIFTGTGEGTFSAYLQDILEGMLSASVLLGTDSRLLIPVLTSTAAFSVQVTNADGDSRTISFTAYLGGVSRSVLRSLNQANIFTERFLAASGNIFFTLRETDGIILMKETELCPLVFIYPATGTLSVTARSYSLSLEGTAGTLYGLNMARLRRQFVETHDCLPSHFTVMLNGQQVIQIGIEKAAVTRDRYLLRFLNSLGSFELLECTGSMSREMEDTDDSSYDVYDADVDGYVRERGREARRLRLTLQTGSLTEERLLFFQDMLSSESVTLLGYGGQDIRVLPSSDDLTFAHRSTEPQSFSIDLLLADEDSRYSKDDVDQMLGDGRIHISQFSNQFC